MKPTPSAPLTYLCTTASESIGNSHLSGKGGGKRKNEAASFSLLGLREEQHSPRLGWEQVFLEFGSHENMLSPLFLS